MSRHIAAQERDRRIAEKAAFFADPATLDAFLTLSQCHYGKDERPALDLAKATLRRLFRCCSIWDSDNVACQAEVRRSVRGDRQNRSPRSSGGHARSRRCCPPERRSG